MCGTMRPLPGAERHTDRRDALAVHIPDEESMMSTGSAPLRRLPMLLQALAGALVLTAAGGCLEGPMGPEGATGPDGPAGAQGVAGDAGEDGEDGQDGEDGPGGEDGQDYTALGYVGMDTCGGCHEEQYEQVIRSGHPYKLTYVGGAAPAPPPEFAGTFPNAPPSGFSWADISYTIGGWGWKVRFMDLDGYIVTSGATEPYTAVQYNIANGSWSNYHAGEDPGTKPYDCGPCHTTGYSPEGNQGGLPGIVGTWTEEGVTCEACHGPGGNHIQNPDIVLMRVDRDSEACGECHIRGDARVIPASGGFTRHHEQWNEMANSKHRALDCVDCHDPHQSAVYSDATWNPYKGIRVDCASCHFAQAANVNTVAMAGFDCVECHMPQGAKSALGDVATFTGDVSSHLFAINTDATAPQFYDDGGSTFTSPYLTLDYACRRCHGAGLGFVKTDAELEAAAVGYHTPQD